MRRMQYTLARLVAGAAVGAACLWLPASSSGQVGTSRLRDDVRRGSSEEDELEPRRGVSELAREGERGVSEEARTGEGGVRDLARPDDDPADRVTNQARETRERLRAIRQRSRSALRQSQNGLDASLEAEAGATSRNGAGVDSTRGNAAASTDGREDAVDGGATADTSQTGDTSDPGEWNRNILRDPRDWNRNPSAATTDGVPSSRLARSAERGSRANISTGPNATSALDPSTLLPPDIGLWFLNSSRNGLVISDVARTGAIAQFGLREGDRILSVNGQQVRTGEDFMTTLFAEEVLDQRVPVVVSRGGRQRIIYLQPNLLMNQLGDVSTDPLEDFGVTFDDRFADQLRVWRVEPRSPAFYAGLRPGDVISNVDGQSITDLGAFAQMLQGNAEFALGVNRSGRMRTLNIDMADLATASSRFASRFGQSRRDANRIDEAELDFPDDEQDNVFGGRRFNLPPKPEVPPGFRTIERQGNLPSGTSRGVNRRGQNPRNNRQPQLPRLNPDLNQQNPGLNQSNTFNGRQYNLPPKPEVPQGFRTIEGGGAAGGAAAGGGAAGGGAAAGGGTGAGGNAGGSSSPQ